MNHDDYGSFGAGILCGVILMAALDSIEDLFLRHMGPAVKRFVARLLGWAWGFGRGEHGQR